EALGKYCRKTAIILHYAAVNTPQQIRIWERDGTTLGRIGRCLLANSELPKQLWGELLLNATPYWVLNMGTPYKAVHGKEATLHHLRAFGSRPFVQIE
ncbi:unnamed protein product, partial [Scytosiphon promiscuus]